MRKMCLAILPWLVACTGPAEKLSAGYINTTQLMQHYHGTAAKRLQIEAQARIWGRSLDSLTAMLPTAPQPAVQREKVVRYRSVLQQKIQAASQRADQELVKEVNRYLTDYGKAHGYDFIFGTSESGTIVYAASGKDLTAEVLLGLNRQYDQRSATPQIPVPTEAPQNP